MSRNGICGPADWDSLFTFDFSVEAIAEAARKFVLNPIRSCLIVGRAKANFTHIDKTGT
jgi:hypothetical protein